MFLLAGLGNPGSQYKETLHNAGFIFLDSLLPSSSWKEQKGALVAKTDIAGQSVLLAKPQLYMNRSGEPIQQLCHFYKIPPENVCVLVDDMNLPLGRVRIRMGGSAGGHNGLKDIIRVLGEGFCRLRIGVGPAPQASNWKDFVLRRLTSTENKILSNMTEDFPQLLNIAYSSNWERAANTYNGKLYH